MCRYKTTCTMPDGATASDDRLYDTVDAAEDAAAELIADYLIAESLEKEEYCEEEDGIEFEITEIRQQEPNSTRCGKRACTAEMAFTGA